MKINIVEEDKSEIMAHIELLHRKMDLILERLNMEDESDCSSDSDDCDEEVEKPKPLKVINLQTLTEEERSDVSSSVQ